MILSNTATFASHIGFAAFSAMCGSNGRHSGRPSAPLVRKTDNGNTPFTQESPLGSAITLTAEAAKHLLQTKQGALAALLQGAL